MAVNTAQYTVTTSASQIVPAGISAEEVHLHVESGTVYLGGDSSVTATTGLKLDTNDKVIFKTHGNAIYAITSTGTSKVYAMWIDQ